MRNEVAGKGGQQKKSEKHMEARKNSMWISADTTAKNLTTDIFSWPMI